MLPRSRLLALALTGSTVGSASIDPNPKNPTDAGGDVGSSDLLRGLLVGVDGRDRNGKQTLTVVPRPLLLRTWTVPP